MKLKGIIAIIFVVLVLVIVIQNTQVVTLQLFFWSVHMSRIVLILVTFAFGVVFGYVIARINRK
jgi:putative membrane protein